MWPQTTRLEDRWWRKNETLCVIVPRNLARIVGQLSENNYVTVRLESTSFSSSTHALGNKSRVMGVLSGHSMV